MAGESARTLLDEAQAEHEQQLHPGTLVTKTGGHGFAGEVRGTINNRAGKPLVVVESIVNEGQLYIMRPELLAKWQGSEDLLLVKTMTLRLQALGAEDVRVSFNLESGKNGSDHAGEVYD